MNRVPLALALSLLLPVGSLKGQQLTSGGYPNVDTTLEIAPGETVRLLNRVLVDRAPGMRPLRRMDYAIRTSIAATDRPGREAQALRVVQALGAEAMAAGARLVAVAICDTDACARRTEPPKDWYVFQRGPAGGWQRVRN